MKEKILLDNKLVEYEMRKSYRARNIRLSFYPTGGLVVTLPWLVGRRYMEKFLQAKADWILKRVNEGRDNILIKASKSDYHKLKE